MVSNELVPRPNADVSLRAVVVDEVPLWDAKVHNIISEMAKWIRNREAFPDMRRKAITNRAEQLEELVFELENGHWEEGILSEQPTVEDADTLMINIIAPSQKSILEMSDAEFDAHWEEMAGRVKADFQAKFKEQYPEGPS